MGSSITDKNGYKKLLKLGMVDGMNSPRTAEAETEAGRGGGYRYSQILQKLRQKHHLDPIVQGQPGNNWENLSQNKNKQTKKRNKKKRFSLSSSKKPLLTTQDIKELKSSGWENNPVSKLLAMKA